MRGGGLAIELAKAAGPRSVASDDFVEHAETGALWSKIERAVVLGLRDEQDADGRWEARDESVSESPEQRRLAGTVSTSESSVRLSKKLDEERDLTCLEGRSAGPA